MRSLGLGAALLLLCATRAAPQAPVRTEGALVRVTTLSPERRVIVGQLVAARADSILVRPRGQGDTVAVATTAATLEVQRGRHRLTGKGLAWGLGIGAVTGMVVGFSSGTSDADCVILCFSARESALMGGLAFGLLGGVGGAVIGTGFTAERWVPVVSPAAAWAHGRPAGSVGIRIAW